MLNARPIPSSRQRGLVLVLALIVLAAMSLAAVGLMRGVFGSNRVAGNLAFQQAAVQAADVGVETAIAWLEQRSAEMVQSSPLPAPMTRGDRLFTNIVKSPTDPIAYLATRADPAPNQTWESFWQTLVAANVVNTMPTDSAGNQVAYIIQRLCANAGNPLSSRCEASPRLSASILDSSQSNSDKPSAPSQVYYRITVRVQSARNATSFIQAMVAI
jgi:type IV pilus assembly protein PilX